MSDTIIVYYIDQTLTNHPRIRKYDCIRKNVTYEIVAVYESFFSDKKEDGRDWRFKYLKSRDVYFNLDICISDLFILLDKIKRSLHGELTTIEKYRDLLNEYKGK